MATMQQNQDEGRQDQSQEDKEHDWKEMNDEEPDNQDSKFVKRLLDEIMNRTSMDDFESKEIAAKKIVHRVRCLEGMVHGLTRILKKREAAASEKASESEEFDKKE